MDDPTLPTLTKPSGVQARRSPWLIWARRILVFGLTAIIVGGLGLALGLIWLSQDLPTIRTLDDYQPHQATVVYGWNDEDIVARFARERRTVVPFDKIPKVMVDAVISAEDAQFFEHTGIDFMGIARCAVKNVLRGRAVCGASTITQQTVKTFFLTPEKKITRKLKEMILAKRLEEALTKQDILYLYLNQIYFGHGAYGVEAASRVYFGKGVDKLKVEEAALLAGLPQAPSRLDPYRHSERAMARRAYVLEQMHARGKITDAQYQEAKNSSLELDWASSETSLASNNHYAAHVRTILNEIVGEKRVESGGLRVYTGVNPGFQKAAENALRTHLRKLDKGLGWRGPIAHLERKALTEALTGLRARLKTSANRASAASKAGSNGTKEDKGAAGKAPVVWDLSALESQRDKWTPDEIPAAARLPRFAAGALYAGPVTSVDDARKEARVDLGGIELVLPHRKMEWARPYSNFRRTPRPRRPSQVLKVGDIVWVRTTDTRREEKKKADRPTYVGLLEQTPKVEGAVVSIDPQSREVRALVGGFGRGAGTFNRAVQAKRQPGSAFKPFVYASAFQTQKYTPISICLDAPRVYRDPWTGESWKPKNYGGTFDGEITLRRALTLSKNLCSVALIDDIGVDPVLDMAKRAGIKTELPRNLTLALGSGGVTPLEIVNAYATLAAQGRVAAPIFVRKIVAPNGEVIFEAKLDEKQTIQPEVVYLTTSVMQSVVEDGTARRVKQLERPVAGKTGTSNEARNGWFIGFTPDLVAGVWVGFDNGGLLGPSATGGSTAIPVWLDFMKTAVSDKPPVEFVAPPNVVFALVDPKSGKLAPPDFEGALNEPFITGTEPTEFAPSEAVVSPDNDTVLLEDY